MKSRNIKWKGTFNSTYYPKTLWIFPTVTGEIDVELSDNVQETNASIALLNYTGIYRRGQVTALNFEYNKDHDLAGRGNQVGLNC